MRVDITGALSVTVSFGGMDTINARLDTLEKQMSDLKTVETQLEQDEEALAAQEAADEKTLADNETLINKLEASGADPDVVAGLKDVQAKFATLIRSSAPAAPDAANAATNAA